MVRWFLLVTAAVGLTVYAEAQDLPPVPKGPVPSSQLAKVTEKDGKVVVRFTRPVVGTKAVQVERDGKKVTENVIAYMWSELPFDVQVDGKEVRVLGGDGKAIDPMSLPKLLAKPTPVIVFSFYPGSGPDPDPFYLQHLKKDVVVFAASSEKFLPPPTNN